MKSLRTVRYSLIAAAVVGSAVVSTPAFAEVSASAGVTNVYLWRGYNLSGGSPAVYGGLELSSEMGAYAGIWGSSSGALNQEIDLYVGYRGEAGGLSYNTAFYAYRYPEDDTAAGAGSTFNNGDYEEVIVNLGFSGVTLDAAIGVGETGGGIVNSAGTADNETTYFALGYTYKKAFAKVGAWNNAYNDLAYTGPGAPVPSNFNHADVGYKFNDNITFTVSKIFGDDDNVHDDPIFQVAYTLPLDLK